MTQASEMVKGIAAIFVTMNRCETARICLAKLEGQTLRPGKVLVIDNASTDATGGMLRDAGVRTGGWIDVITLETNLGNAGGMQIAFERAFADGADAVWVLDDDSWPEPEALERLLAADLPADAVRSCRVVDLATGRLSWPLQIPDRGGWRMFEAEDSLPQTEAIPIRRSWLGALIPRAVYETVGPIEGRFFLRGEDEDYPRRVERAGFSTFLVTGALLHHPPSGRLHRWRVFGHDVMLESGLKPDNIYYRLRNDWWMVRRDKGLIAALTRSLIHFLILLQGERPISAWLPSWWQAFRDALRNRLGARHRPEQ